MTLELLQSDHEEASRFGFILPHGHSKKLRYEVSTTTHSKSVVSNAERCKDKNGNIWIVLKQHRTRCVIVNMDYTESRIITPENVSDMFTDGQFGLVWEEQKQSLFVSDVCSYDADEYDIPDEIMQLSSCVLWGTLRADGKLYVESICSDMDEDVELDSPIVLHGKMLDFIRTKHDQWL